MRVCLSVCMCVCTYVCACVYVRVILSMFEVVYPCMRARVCVCVDACFYRELLVS